MEDKKLSKQAKRRLDEIEMEYEIANRQSNLNRARSITVGNAFGGVVEITMRGDGTKTLWSIMTPVEVIELVHQLAASVGCHIAVKPREDFSSWREWRPEAKSSHWPLFLSEPNHFTNSIGTSALQQLSDQSNSNNITSNVFSQLKINQEQPKEQIDESMASKKPSNKRVHKRSSTSS